MLKILLQCKQASVKNISFFYKLTRFLTIIAHSIDEDVWKQANLYIIDPTVYYDNIFGNSITMYFKNENYPELPLSEIYLKIEPMYTLTLIS